MYNLWFQLGSAWRCAKNQPTSIVRRMFEYMRQPTRGLQFQKNKSTMLRKLHPVTASIKAQTNDTVRASKYRTFAAHAVKQLYSAPLAVKVAERQRDMPGKSLTTQKSKTKSIKANQPDQAVSCRGERWRGGDMIQILLRFFFCHTTSHSPPRSHFSTQPPWLRDPYMYVPFVGIFTKKPGTLVRARKGGGERGLPGWFPQAKITISIFLHHSNRFQWHSAGLQTSSFSRIPPPRFTLPTRFIQWCTKKLNNRGINHTWQEDTGKQHRFFCFNH